MIPRHLREEVAVCHTHDYEPLNTSDHVPITMSIRMDDIPCGAIAGVQHSKLRWDKLSPEVRVHRYQAPLDASMGEMLIRFRYVRPSKQLIDDTLQGMIELIKHHEKAIPRSRFRANIKSYWCPELDALKQTKVYAFRLWLEAGRPRDINNQLYINNKLAKKNFRNRLKQIAREYDEEKVRKAALNAEIDHTAFWKMLKRERDGPCAKTPSIKDPVGKVVHEVPEILQVWKNHFSSLGIPAESPSFNQEHYNTVNAKLDELIASVDDDDFSRDIFTIEEVSIGIKNLNSGKAPGFDRITKEHLAYGGFNLIRVLTMLFNWIREIEYIPINFRRGVQIPLYKGKNTFTLDVNNYRGITLLTIFNKLFEVVIWKRIERWWSETGAISQLQGACRKRHWCGLIVLALVC